MQIQSGRLPYWRSRSRLPARNRHDAAACAAARAVARNEHLPEVATQAEGEEVGGGRDPGDHAKDPQARRFYERFGFEPSLQLLLLIKDARKAFGSRARPRG